MWDIASPLARAWPRNSAASSSLHSSLHLPPQKAASTCRSPRAHLLKPKLLSPQPYFWFIKNRTLEKILNTIHNGIKLFSIGKKEKVIQLRWGCQRGTGGNFCAEVAAAAAKSLQSCPTLCDPIDGSPQGSPVPGILQARTLEWVAISFSNAWKWEGKVKSLSHV